MTRQKPSKHQKHAEHLRRERQRERIILFGLIILGSLILVFAFIRPQVQSIGTLVSVTPADLPNPNGLSLGDASTPVTIDVFEDFQCPACQYFTESIETLVIKNLVTAGKARYVFHNYPFIDGQGISGGESDQAANASLCANEQGKFWEMHSILYANWKGENQGNLSDSRLQAMAKNIGLDMNAFDECFKANKYKAALQADLDKGTQMGVNGTPTVFVNGKLVGQPGKIATYDEIAQAVSAALTAP